MNPKIERVNKDIEKARGKITELQNSLREMERRKTELENMEIVDVVRGMDISLADLATLLKDGGITSGQLDPKLAQPTEPTQTETEDSEDEE